VAAMNQRGQSPYAKRPAGGEGEVEEADEGGRLERSGDKCQDSKYQQILFIPVS